MKNTKIYIKCACTVWNYKQCAMYLYDSIILYNLRCDYSMITFT